MLKEPMPQLHKSESDDFDVMEKVYDNTAENVGNRDFRGNKKRRIRSNLTLTRLFFLVIKMWKRLPSKYSPG